MRALDALDDEAFVWLAIALTSTAGFPDRRARVWPDGLGGFRSRAAIEAVQRAAAEYLTRAAP